MVTYYFLEVVQSFYQRKSTMNYAFCKSSDITYILQLFLENLGNKFRVYAIDFEENESPEVHQIAKENSELLNLQVYELEPLTISWVFENLSYLHD